MSLRCFVILLTVYGYVLMADAQSRLTHSQMQQLLNFWVRYTPLRPHAPYYGNRYMNARRRWGGDTMPVRERRSNLLDYMIPLDVYQQPQV